MRVVLGIDVSKVSSEVAILVNGEKVHGYTMANDAIGFSRLLGDLKTVHKPEIIFEATGVYSRRLQAFLDEHSYAYTRLNPLEAKKQLDSLRVRKTDQIDAVKLANKQAETINRAVKSLLSQYPIRSITSDNGSEFSSLSDLKGVEVYFAHPYASHERGTNENFNGLLREFLPKGVSLNSLTTEELNHYVSAINDRPRRLHKYKTANILFGLAQTA